MEATDGVGQVGEVRQIDVARVGRVPDQTEEPVVAGAVLGGLLLGVFSDLALLPVLAAILLASAVKLARHDWLRRDDIESGPVRAPAGVLTICHQSLADRVGAVPACLHEPAPLSATAYAAEG